MQIVTAPVIVTEDDYHAALARFDALFGTPPGHPGHGEYMVLADLIEAYENRHHPAPVVTGRALLAELMEEHGLSQTQVPEVGPQPLVSAVLTGRRRINARMAMALAKRFGLRADDFLG